MAISFIKKLADLKLHNFSFDSVLKEMTSGSDDEPSQAVITMYLIDPIERVVGSGKIYNPESEDSSDFIHVQKTDVTAVKVMLRVMEENEADFTFEMNPDDTLLKGSYSGNLFMEVSKAGEVWLTDKKFSNFKKEVMRKDRQARWAAAKGL